MLCIACWIGDKSTMGDLCYFNNATHHLCLKLKRKLLGFQLSSLLPLVLSRIMLFNSAIEYEAFVYATLRDNSDKLELNPFLDLQSILFQLLKYQLCDERE